MADVSINNPISGANNQNQVYSMTKSSAQKSNISMNDFLLLVVAQMQNMDMNSAPDNGQFMTQMAQMASMQAMQELTAAYMSTMSVSYMGKYVKAEAITNTGERANAEGIVSRVNFNGGDAMVLVDNIWFRVQDIYELNVSAPEKPTASESFDNFSSSNNADANTNTVNTGNTANSDNTGGLYGDISASTAPPAGLG